MGDREAILAAIENRRRSSTPPSPTLAPASSSRATSPKTLHYADFDKDHDRRQEFRRLVDPGITRPNSREVAYEAIKTLSTIAGNIIDHPDDKKYQKFKTTNTIIRKKLVDPKGTLEYAVELGFRPEVIDFQPYYIFNKSSWNDLLIGHAVLKEFGQREAEKEQHLARARAEEKAAIEAQKEKIRLAFLDDRKSKLQADERERELRAARAARPPSPEPATEPVTPPQMPGGGFHLLGSPTHATTDIMDE